jgi:nitroreductase
MPDASNDTIQGQELYRVQLAAGIEDLAATVRECRSYRRFDEAAPISRDLMLAFVDLARRCASAGNRQPLRYHVVSDSPELDMVFPRLRWAADLKDWDGPVAGERPTGYIVVAATEPMAPIARTDAGIAAQTIMLAATQAGFGGCMLASVEPDLLDVLGVRCVEDGREVGLQMLLVLALGKPAEKVVLEPVAREHGTTYWRDADGTHHVPKRSLAEVLV